MPREKHKRRKPQGESTNAGDWGGSTRTSDEIPVMGVEQRGRVRRSYLRTNWRQDDADGYDRRTIHNRQATSVRGLQIPYQQLSTEAGAGQGVPLCTLAHRHDWYV